MEYRPGRFAADGKNYLCAETRQRREALAHASPGADWVLQIDTDEVLPNWAPVRRALDLAESLQLAAVEWPLRVLFRRLPNGRYLEIVSDTGSPQYDYATVAVRPCSELIHCRKSAGPFLRLVVRGDRSSPDVRRPPSSEEHRAELLHPGEAIWHNSWARSPSAVRRKIASWGHHDGMRSWLYYYTTWLPAPVTWRVLRRFHPIQGQLWPHLQISKDMPRGLDD
jgi:hypothetical protein